MIQLKKNFIFIFLKFVIKIIVMLRMVPTAIVVEKKTSIAPEKIISNKKLIRLNFLHR